MRKTSFRLIRRAASGLWVGLLAMLMALVIGSHLVPLTGGSLYIIRGGSMAPAIPLGSLLVNQPADPRSLTVGDVITIRTPEGRNLTHRISRIVTDGDELWFEIGGDANPAPDRGLVPASAVAGRTAFHIPLAGYLVAMLSMPTGMVSLFSLIGSLLVGSWLLDDLEHVPERARDAPLEAARKASRA